MEKVIDGLRYDTKNAELIASDRYWDGSNWERSGRNTYLYKTKKGNFFLHHTTMWQGEREQIQPLTKQGAMAEYEQLPEIEVGYFEAFGEHPEEA